LNLIISNSIESFTYNLGGTGPILRVKNPLQRVNGHAVNRYYSKYIVIVQLNLSPSREAISLIRQKG
jgi:hypothetical protein